MRTLADVKRRVKPGVVVEITNHHYGHLNGRRTIVTVQSKKFTMTVPGQEPKESWFDWPKSRDVRIDGPDTVTMIEDGQTFFTMRFTEEGV